MSELTPTSCLKYKCRRCNEVFDGPVSGYWNMMVQIAAKLIGDPTAVVQIPIGENKSPPMSNVEMHPHADHEIGIGDLVGVGERETHVLSS